LNGATNCTITNVSAHATGQGAYAIHLGNSQNNSLSNFSASSSDDIAVRLQNAIYNALSDFTAASDTGYALYLYQSANNTLSNFSAIALDETAIRIFNSASNNLTNFAATTRTDRFERHAIEVNSNSPYNRLSNFTAISNESGVIGIYQSASNIISFGRLISSNTQEYPLVELGGNSNRNAFYLNNFTENSGMYVEDNAGSYGVYNYFNYTHEGKNQGNIWGNVADGAVQVKGYVNSSIRGFQIGTSGAGRPYNAVTSQGKVGGSAPVVDYAPLTNRHALTLTTYPYLNAGGYAYGANASVPYGTYVNISAANRAGYKFRVWDVISYQGERCIITNRMAANTTVLMLGGDCRLQVGFGNATRTNLTIQVSPSGAGSISVARDIYGSAISVNYSGPEYGGNPTVIASSFEYGENPKINATSNAGFVFSNWTRVSGDCSVFHVPCSNINPVGGCNTNPKSIVGMHFTDCVLRANFNSTGSG
ncbi:MAG: NosD domain-containing protein, partial [Candidatus Micrarchaeia archaeon]